MTSVLASVVATLRRSLRAPRSMSRYWPCAIKYRCCSVRAPGACVSSRLRLLVDVDCAALYAPPSSMTRNLGLTCRSTKVRRSRDESNRSTTATSWRFRTPAACTTATNAAPRSPYRFSSWLGVLLGESTSRARPVHDLPQPRVARASRKAFRAMKRQIPLHAELLFL
jgi:hypothetical protein